MIMQYTQRYRDFMLLAKPAAIGFEKRNYKWIFNDEKK